MSSEEIASSRASRGTGQCVKASSVGEAWTQRARRCELRKHRGPGPGDACLARPASVGSAEHRGWGLTSAREIRKLSKTK